MKRLIPTLLMVAAAFAAQAAYTAEAISNATIQQAGPRTGSNGLAFFNIEGQGVAPQFRSWGAADFSGSSFGVPGSVTSISDFKVVLTQSNAAFTVAGNVEFWLSSDTTTSILAGTSTLVWFDDVNPDGVGNQLPLVALGSGTFNQTGAGNNGTVDTYSFTLNAQAEQLILDAINNNGTIRLVVTPEDDNGPANVSATWAGYTNTTYPGPTLSFEANGGSPVVTLTNVTTTAGIAFGGSLASLGADDNDRYIVLCDENDSTGQIDIAANSSNPLIANLTGTVESRASRNDLSEFTRVFNTSSNSYENLNFRTTTLADSSFNIATSGANHVAGNGDILFRMTWIPQTDIDAGDGWTMSVDLFVLSGT